MVKDDSPPAGEASDVRERPNFGSFRQIIYIFITVLSICIAANAVIEVQAREDLRGTIANEKVKWDARAADLSSVGGVDGSEEIQANRTCIDCSETALKRLIEYGAYEGSSKLQAIWRTFENKLGRDEAIPFVPLQRGPWYYSAYFLIVVFSVLLASYVGWTLYCERMKAREQAPLIELKQHWKLLLAAIVICLICALLGALSIRGTLAYLKGLSSNSLVALAMVFAGILGVMSDLANHVLRGRIGRTKKEIDHDKKELEQSLALIDKYMGTIASEEGEPTAVKFGLYRNALVQEAERRAEFSRNQDMVRTDHHGGLLMMTIGALVGLMAFILIKSGKQVFLSQFDPSDVSLDPFSSVLAAYILALFSPRYFKKLDDIAQAALPDVH